MPHGSTVPLATWSGEGKRRVQITSNTAVWSHAGTPVGPRRGGLIGAPHGRCVPQAWLATPPQRPPVQLLTSLVRRWQLEATCAEARAHLGVETQRQGSDRAPTRTTPAWLALDSLVTLMAARLLGTHPLPVRTAAWSRTAPATCADTMAWGRQGLWRQGHVSTSQAEAAVVKIPRALVERLTDTLC
jgi:hypothetical protein